MQPAQRPQDRNVDGILAYIRDYLEVRQQQAVRINPKLANVLQDIIWIQLENLRQVLMRLKAFGGEKFRVADVLAGADDGKRKALLSISDQNSLMPEIINRGDEQTRRVAELAIHDMRTLFRYIDPSLENVVQLIQHWLVWDLPDAADLHHFDEQGRRLETLRGLDLSDDIKARYRPALSKTTDQTVTDEEILGLELRRLELIAARFIGRRNEDEAYQMIIKRCDEADGQHCKEADGQPYDYKRGQAEELRERYEKEKQKISERGQRKAPTQQPAPEPEPTPMPEAEEQAEPKAMGDTASVAPSAATQESDMIKLTD